MAHEKRILRRLLVSVTLILGVSGPVSAGFDATAANSLDGPGAARSGAARSGGVQVAMSDLEAFGLGAGSAVPQLTDSDYLPRILALYRAGDVEEADILRSKLVLPATQAIAEWVAIRTRAIVGYERLATFQDDFPDWPVTSLIRRRIEEALLRGRRPAVVRRYFQDQVPISSPGRLALAFALKADSQAAQAADLVRHLWREDTFGNDLEERILDEFPGILGQADHRHRMERLLLKESWGPATRAAGRAGKEYLTLVKARMGVFQGGKAADKAFAAVPESLRSDSSYIFSRALFLRRKNKMLDAAKVMAQAPRDPAILADGDEWWTERRRIARELLDKGEHQAAYDVASQHAAETAAERIEAEFHAGWIALRFLHQPDNAAKHFAEASNIAASPISVSRAAYWQGRAAEAAGAAADARRFYQRAGDRPITYYGQLAREKLGWAVELRRTEPLDPEARKDFEASTPIQALGWLHQLGETDLAIALYLDLAQMLKDPAQLDALGQLAVSQGNARALLSLGKTAVQRGFPLDLHAYPTIGIPEFQPVRAGVETAMVYAIARQESAFNPRALSSAGARGLMQLMPDTARRTAQRFGLGYDVQKLIEDPQYNAKVGSAHLSELMEDWKGSHVLAFASYNAGGGNVMKWVRAYGDPRKPGVDMVDWIERIPFHETRNYVQRVLENLTVYRRRLEQPGTEPKAEPTRSADAMPSESVRY